MAWATPTDVDELTGVTVDVPSIARAQAIVELFCGRSEATAVGLLKRDAEWLRRAVAYQAAWMPDRPDLFGQMEATQISQDGLTAKIESAAQVLAPLARRSLKKLSWRGNRSVSVSSVFDTLAGVPPYYPAAVGVGGVWDTEDHPTWPDDNWRPE